MRPKRSIVVGCTGQDGTLLTNALLLRGDDVIGIGRWGCCQRQGVGVSDVVDIFKSEDVLSLFGGFSPDEIYYLAAHHGSSEAAQTNWSLAAQYDEAHRVHVVGLLNFLEAMVKMAPVARLFYASSSLVFSGETGEFQNEKTPLSPKGIYGITKVQGMYVCREYRSTHNLHASVGILYNHESYLRPGEFLTSKIIRTAIRLSQGSAEKLIVGSLSSCVDWGYAPDYVDAFMRILELQENGEYVVATGEAHTVSQFIELVFQCFGLDPKIHVSENGGILTRSPLVKVGNSGKLRKATGWAPTYSFPDFVRQLVKDHLAAK